MRTTLILIALIIAVATGAAAAQQQDKDTKTPAAKESREERDARLQKESDRVRELCEGLMSDTRLDPIRSKVAFSLAEQTDAMKADTSRPTPEERPAIALLAGKRDECLVATEKMVTANYPTPLSVLMGGQRPLGRALLAALYEGRISYGEYARMRAEAHQKFMTKQNEIVNELNQNEPNSPFVAAETALRAREAIDAQRRELRPKKGNECLEFGKTVACD